MPKLTNDQKIIGGTIAIFVVAAIFVFVILFFFTGLFKSKKNAPEEETQEVTNLSKSVSLTSGSISVGEVPETSSYMLKEYYPTRDINETIEMTFEFTVPDDEALSLVSKWGINIKYYDTTTNALAPLIGGRAWVRGTHDDAFVSGNKVVYTRNIFDDIGNRDELLQTIDFKQVIDHIYVRLSYTIEGTKYNGKTNEPLEDESIDTYTKITIEDAEIFKTKIDEIDAGTLDGFSTTFNMNLGDSQGVQSTLTSNLDDDIFIHLQAPHRTLASFKNLRFKVEDNLLNVYELGQPEPLIRGLTYSRLDTRIDPLEMTYILKNGDNKIIHLVGAQGVVQPVLYDNLVDNSNATYKLNFVRYNNWKPITYLLPVNNDKQGKIKYFSSTLNGGKFPNIIYKNYTEDVKFKVQEDNNIVLRINSVPRELYKDSKWVGGANRSKWGRIQIVLNNGKMKFIDTNTELKPTPVGNNNHYEPFESNATLGGVSLPAISSYININSNNNLSMVTYFDTTTRTKIIM